MHTRSSGRSRRCRVSTSWPASADTALCTAPSPDYWLPNRSWMAAPTASIFRRWPSSDLAARVRSRNSTSSKIEHCLRVLLESSQYSVNPRRGNLMRIGVVFPQIEIGSDPIVIRDYAQAVEGMGYTHILAYDHVLGASTANRPGWNRPYTSKTPFHEPFVLFGYLAGLTRAV